jgi:bifunctional UDP-N-acetylglucosamine pyrophosphorylase/glucosamine-1-phosphate N-acetyltransferase
MPVDNIVPVILAAGKGTRMHSDKPKVLQNVLRRPMLAYVYDALDKTFAAPAVTVVGFGADQVRAAFPERAELFALQEEQLGTGHALQVAWDAARKCGAEYCAVINGDTPLVTPDSMRMLAEAAGRSDVAFMTIAPNDPASFGRVVRDENSEISAIVEAKDYDISVHGPVTGEVNAGIYLFRFDAVEPLLQKLSNDNMGGEYYITDLIGFAVNEGLRVKGVQCGNDTNLMGINSPLELVKAEQQLRRSIVENLLGSGVLIHNPDTVIIGPDVDVQPGAEIFGHCEIYGKSVVEKGCVMGSYTMVRDSNFRSGAELREFSHIEKAEVGPGCVVGPYARLRPGARLEKDAKVGNFVEVKKAVLGEGAKASHLSYIGDAEVGAHCNIGAGTITCNYDGKNKHKTVIDEGAFIGSNTAIVAPCTIGRGALVGAGSTVTKDVPEDQTAVARAKQVNIPRRSNRS